MTEIDIPNARFADGNVLVGGQPAKQQLVNALEHGYQAVINLRASGEFDEYDEARAVETLGMRYVHIPVAGPEDLTRENARRLHQALLEAADAPVIAHCASGNRVGALMALRAGLLLAHDQTLALRRGTEAGLDPNSSLFSVVESILAEAEPADALSQANIDRFNELAAEWDNDPRHTTLAEAVADAITQNVPLSGAERVLEFGSGTGLVTLQIAPQVKRILAMDSSADMLDELRNKADRLGVSNVALLEGNLPDTRPDGRFDLILSSMTLHHIGDLETLFRLLFDLLEGGGRIALADLDREDGSFHGDKPGIAHHGFDREEVEQWLQAAGFESITFATAHHMEKTDDDGQVRHYPVFLVCAVRPRA